MPAALVPDLLEVLDGLGVGVASFEDHQPAAPDELWTLEILHQSEPDPVVLAEAISRLGRELDLPPVDLEVSPVPDTDWLEAVSAQFPPQRVGRFWIHGSHDEGTAPPDLIPLKLDAGLAFGSGEHATTRGCLTMLDTLARRRRFRRVLDLGCGAGVLAIAAAKCWPARVIAADNDRAAVEVAHANARDNGIGANLQVVESDGFSNPLLRTVAPYDLILANILAEPLIELAPAFARALTPDGSLVLSGLLVEQAGPVALACRAQGLCPIWLIEDGPWATLQLRRLRRLGRADGQRVHTAGRAVRRRRSKDGPQRPRRPAGRRRRPSR